MALTDMGAGRTHDQLVLFPMGAEPLGFDAVTGDFIRVAGIADLEGWERHQGS